jgi:hypothetical protein
MRNRKSANGLTVNAVAGSYVDWLGEFQRGEYANQ